MSKHSDRPKQDGRKSSVTEEQLDLYAGPLEFIEPGARGFLVSTLPKKEEFAIDDAIDLLRQAAIQVYGGYKPVARNCKGLERNGFVKVDCLDLEAVKVWPHPGGDDMETLEKKEGKAAAEEQVKETKKGGENVKDEKKEDAEEEKMDEDKASKQEQQKENNEEAKDAEEKDGPDKQKTDTEEKTEGKEKDKSNERQEKDQQSKEEQKDSKIPRMHSIYNFKSYRTEMRNTMFIKSNLPDPMAVAEAAMELVVKRKSITGDSVVQLLPVIGVCQYDYQQLEVMTRRTLSSVLNDETGEPQSFAVMLIDKLSEPGSEVVFEVARNTVWSVNPMAWMSSPIAEPDFVLRFELIGSSLVFSCLRHYMKYRQYAPTSLVDFGEGHAEDDDGGWMSEEAKKVAEEKRKEKELQREQERQKEEERQKERAKKLLEAEEKRKKREEERKKRQTERKEKDSSGNKSDNNEKGGKSQDKDEKSSGKDGLDEKEDTPPSKKQRKVSGIEEESAGENKLDMSTTEEIPPSKKQRVNLGAETTKEDEDMLLGNEPKEETDKDAEETEEEEKKTPTKRTTRGTRSGKKVKARQANTN